MAEFSIYQKLKNGRKAKNLTQKELSELLCLPQGYISQVEAGKHDIKLSTLTDWARVLGFELMLLPKKEAREVFFLVESSSGDISGQTAPGYGPLPEGLTDE